MIHPHASLFLPVAALGIAASLAACSSEPASSGYDPSTMPASGGADTGAVPGTGALPGAGGSPATGGVAPTTGGTSGTGATGGTPPGAGGTPATGGASGSQFTLLWQDDFDSFDGNRWGISGHTFPENAGVFTDQNVVVEGGLLKLRVTNQAREEKAYSAAEIYSKQEFKYGRFEARIKFHRGSGIVSSLFTYKWNVDVRWNEIDIEYLGNQPQAVQYNLITSPFGNWQNLTYRPYHDDVGVPPHGDFYEYAFEWTPENISFFINGIHRTTFENVGDFTEAITLRMNCWPTENSVTQFAGQLNGANDMPAEAQYDWVRVYSYTP